MMFLDAVLTIANIIAQYTLPSRSPWVSAPASDFELPPAALPLVADVPLAGTKFILANFFGSSGGIVSLPDFTSSNWRTYTKNILRECTSKHQLRALSAQKLLAFDLDGETLSLNNKE
uniref:Uncharacterized protein n=1 Tax=Glossina austeni TaxID=7395 RepID=A0A1A9UPG2_GLOAU